MGRARRRKEEEEVEMEGGRQLCETYALTPEIVA